MKHDDAMEISQLARAYDDERERAAYWEARCARLQQSLRRELEQLEMAVALFAPHGGDSSRTGDYYAAAQIMESVRSLEALAGLDTPADSQPEDGTGVTMGFEQALAKADNALDVLRDAIDWPTAVEIRKRYREALDYLEAELSRLREELASADRRDERVVEGGRS